MTNSVIGALRIVLGADTAALEDGLKGAQRSLKRFGRDVEKIGMGMAKLGGALSVGLTLPLIALGKASRDAADEQLKATAAVDAALKSMGQTAGFTSQQLGDMASNLQAASTFGDEAILSDVTANLLTFGNVQGDVFKRAQQAALDLSARLGQDLQSSAIQLGKALNDPIRGLTALSRVGVAFTDQQKEQVKAMVAAGQTAKAQSFILGELEKQYGGQAAALAQTDWGKEQQAINSLGDAMELLGMSIREVMPDIASAIKSVADAFTALSPEMRKAIFIIGGIAAVIGPVISVLGILTAGIGSLITALSAGGAAATAFGVALKFMLGPIGLAITAVAALTLGLGLYYGQALGVKKVSLEMSGTLTAVEKAMNEYREATDKARVATGKDRDTALEAVKAKRYLAEQAIKTARAQLVEARATQVLATTRMNDAAASQRFDANIGEYVTQDGAVSFYGQRAKKAEADAKAAEAAIAKAEGSLNEIAASLGKPLKIDLSVENSVTGLGNAASAAAKKTEDLAAEWQRLQDIVMSPTARDAKEQADYFAGINKQLDAGKISAKDAAEALRKWDQMRERAGFNDNIQQVDQNPNLNDSALPDKTLFNGQLMSEEQVKGIQEQMTGAFRGAFQALRYGGTKGLFEWMADSLSNRLMDNLANDLSKLLMDFARQMQATNSGGGGGLNWGTIANGVASFFGGAQGFATGGSFKVGGSGRADSKFVGMRVTPGEMVDIRKPGNDNGGSGALSVHVQPSPYFDVAVQRAATPIAAAASAAAYTNAVRDAPAKMNRQARSRLG